MFLRWPLFLAVVALSGCSDDNGGLADAAHTDWGGGDAAVRDFGLSDASRADGSPSSDLAGDATAQADGAVQSCGTIVTFADGKQPTVVLHVAPSGNDDTGDGTAANPYETIEKAAGLAQPGTAVRLLAGTYPGGAYLANLAGTAAAPIWIGGAPGAARPVIEGGGEGLHLSKVRYLVLHDLEVRLASNNGINCDDGSEYANPDATRYVVFRNLDVHDVGGTGNQDCLKLSGVDDFFVLGSSFAHCGGNMSGSGIDHVGCHHGLIAGNSFANHSGNAIQCKGGSEDIEIRANTMVDAGERAVNMGGSTGTQYFRPPLSTTTDNVEARNIRVVANVIMGGTTAFAFVGCDDCLAANNTIITPHNWLLRILQETTSAGGYTFLPCQNGRVVNNIFYFDESDLSTYLNIGPDTSPATFVFDSNLWYAYDDPSMSAPSLPVTETNGIVGQDPQLVAPAQDNYHISAASPAAGKGAPLSEVASDRDGNCYDTPPSIGAYAAP